MENSRNFLLEETVQCEHAQSQLNTSQALYLLLQIWSDCNCLIEPRILMNRPNELRNEYVSNEFAASRCIARHVKQVKRTPYLSKSFQPSRIRNGPTRSTAQYVSGGGSVTLSIGISAIVWSCNCL